MLDWMLMPYRRYAEFTGRSRRMEYWMFTLFGLLVAVFLVALMFAGGLDIESLTDPTAPPPEPDFLFWIGVGLLTVFGLGSVVPSIAVAVRRFHDRGMTGWWVVIFAVLGSLPYVGWIASIANIIIMALPGNQGANQYGDDPINPTTADVFS